MTAKELVLEKAPNWTEEQAAAALRAAGPELQLTVEDTRVASSEPNGVSDEEEQIPTFEESIAILASIDFPPREDAWR
jgi:hypothetical protein